jgi:hypothetical protein
MISEYDLDCANCGSSLTRREVGAETLGVAASDSLAVAECPDCGGRYFPESTLERLRT